MTVYYVDDGGSATAPYDTWAKAATSLSALDDAVAFASGDIVYIGHDHVCQYAHAANRTITGPTSGLPTLIISATTGSDPPTYQASTTNQVDTSEGAYTLTFDGSFALYGVRLKSGSTITFASDSDEALYAENCTLAPGANTGIATGVSQALGLAIIKNAVIDLTADGTTNRSTTVFSPGNCALFEINGLSFVNPEYRTGLVVAPNSDQLRITGADFSGFTNGTSCEIIGPPGSTSKAATIINSLTAATWTPISASPGTGGAVWEFYNVGPADAPTYLYVAKYTGTVASSASIYRTGGATVEGDATGWLITTTANCSESVPWTSPYMYGLVSSTGSKTFDVYITNDTADFTDAEVWLEVEYLGTADEAQWTLAKNQRATITTTAAAQTDDTSSTWNGSGPSFTYKQKLSVTATVNETGQYRARVCVGVASIASSRYFYVDPKVTVS